MTTHLNATRHRRRPWCAATTTALALAALGTVTAASRQARAEAPAALSFGRAQCVALVRNSAAFVPGLDVEGRRVAPADVAGGVTMPAEITVPIYGLYGWNRGVVAAPLLAVATVRGDGQVSVNGEPLDPSDTTAAVERCRRMLAAGN